MATGLHIKALPFQRKLRCCPKCGGKVRRHYCEGKYGNCGDIFSPLRGKEHFNLNCQECGYEFYERVSHD